MFAQQNPPPQPMTDEKYGTAQVIMALPPAKLVEILKDPGGSPYAKAKACQRLAVTGGPEAVPALAALLADPQLSHYARTGLDQIPGPAADEALRAALRTLQGRLLAGVIHSVARRRDSAAIPALARLQHDTDPAVAKAAYAALAAIRPPL
ncbi:MAG: hypothetical protein FJW39_14610 [Acidobacteria bacterium]|nr:hypothetical protein [Acidobacteriota bacterium]